jgi:CDGSH-type Zn-finger protein
VTYITITPTDNGPYLVSGGAMLVDAEGKEYEVRDPVALCRCGHSSAKPFCDGAHERAGFSALDRAGELTA